MYFLVLKSLHGFASNLFAVIVLKFDFIDLGPSNSKKWNIQAEDGKYTIKSGVFSVTGSDWLIK